MARFLTANGKTLWAGIDPDCRCVEPKIADLRFAAYLAPFKSEEDAAAALLAVGGVLDEPNPPPKHGRLK